MEEYKKEFIEFMVDSHVLKFGEFTLKSGRKSPFFMNAGAYKSGSQLIKLGEFYARAIHDNYGLDFDVLFGPAYKGIPLTVATVMGISKLYGRDIRYVTNDDGSVSRYYLTGTDSNGNRIVVYDVEDKDGIAGDEIILQKVQIAREWLKASWGVDLDALRQEVQRKQVSYDIDELRQQVYSIH